MKTILLLLVFFNSIISSVYAQSSGSSFETKDRFSISAGYGNQGLSLGLDLKFHDLNMNNTWKGSLKLYLNCDLNGQQFQESNFILNGNSYSSGVLLSYIGLGVGADFKYKRLSIYPYLGLRFYYVEFTDANLVDALGTDPLTRYETDANGNQFQVGSVVSNGYGDAISIDVGTWIGFHISPRVEIGGLIGISPVTFDTDATLFGKYWGEAPYPNLYYVQVSTIRAEARLKLNF